MTNLQLATKAWDVIYQANLQDKVMSSNELLAVEAIYTHRQFLRDFFISKIPDIAMALVEKIKELNLTIDFQIFYDKTEKGFYLLGTVICDRLENAYITSLFLASWGDAPDRKDLANVARAIWIIQERQRLLLEKQKLENQINSLEQQSKSRF